MQREETVMLAILLQQCTICTRAPSDISCRVVQELHKSLVLVVEKGNLFNIEEEIWEGVRKDPMVATALTRVPTLKMFPHQVSSQMAEAEELTHSTSPDHPSVLKQEGAAPPLDLTLVPRRQPPPPSGFSSLAPEYLTTSPFEMTISHTPVMSKVYYHLHVQSLTRITLLSTST